MFAVPVPAGRPDCHAAERLVQLEKPPDFGRAEQLSIGDHLDRSTAHSHGKYPRFRLVPQKGVAFSLPFSAAANCCSATISTTLQARASNGCPRSDSAVGLVAGSLERHRSTK
jgi:hypothetical protein